MHSNMDESQTLYISVMLEGRHQRTHTLWFHLYELLEKAKLIDSDTNQISVASGEG